MEFTTKFPEALKFACDPTINDSERSQRITAALTDDNCS